MQLGIYFLISVGMLGVPIKEYMKTDDPGVADAMLLSIKILLPALLILLANVLPGVMSVCSTRGGARELLAGGDLFADEPAAPQLPAAVEPVRPAAV